MNYIAITTSNNICQLIKRDEPLTIHETIIVEMHDKQQELIKAMTQERICVWTHDHNENEGKDYYASNSGCGHRSLSSKDNVTNGYKLCPFCGREIFINPITCY